jgi:hypothetical protein
MNHLNFFGKAKRRRAIVLILVMLCGAAPWAQAATYVWTNTTATSANFTDPNIWNRAGSPGGADNTSFTNNLIYTVNFTGSVLDNNNLFNGGTVTLNIGAGQSWTGTYPSGGWGDAAFQIGSSATATVYLAGGTLAATNTANNAMIALGYQAKGTLWVTNGAVIDNLTRLGTYPAGQGALIISGSNSTYTNSDAFYVGYGYSSSGNSLVVSNSGSLAVNSTFTVGNNAGNGSGGNSMLLDSNARLWTGAGATIGNSMASNTATVQGGAVWNLGAQTLYVGNGFATGNVLVVNGGVVTNVAGVAIGYNGSQSYQNSVTISNGGQLFLNSGNTIFLSRAGSSGTYSSFNVGGLGAASTVSGGSLSVGEVVGGNSVTVTNATLLSGGWVWIGNGSASSNTVTVQSGGVWNLGGNGINVGTSGNGNVLTVVGGGIVTNAGGITLGQSSGSVGNSLAITNGGKFFTGNGLTIGNAAGASNNSFNVGGAGLASTATVGSVTVGKNAAAGNTMTVTNATLLSGTTTIGDGSSSNTATVQAGGLWNLQGNTVTVGSGAASSNMLWVRSGGILEVGSGGGLITGAGAGNQITNSGGVYQFSTATPTITTNAGTGTVGKFIPIVRRVSVQ